MRTEHEQKINYYIPIAIRAAKDAIKGKNLPEDERDNLFNRVYHKTMTDLTVEAGLRVR